MNIIIQSPGFKASDSLEEFINQKLEKIGQHSHNIMRADVILTKGPESELRNNHCEIRLEVPGNDHFVKKNSRTFEYAVTESVIALEHMMERSKGKSRES